MAGAACAASFFVGAKAYYVQGKTGDDISKSKVIDLPIPNIPSYRSIDKAQFKVLAVLHQLGAAATNSALRSRLNISPQKLSYHVKELERQRLIKTSRNSPSYPSEQNDRRRVYVQLTNAGKLMVSWNLQE